MAIDRALDKSYLIDKRWRYTGKFPHCWQDPSADGETSHSIDTALRVQSERDNAPVTLVPHSTHKAKRMLLTLSPLLEKLDKEFMEAGLAPSAPERLTIDRLRKMCKEQKRENRTTTIEQHSS